MHFVVRGVGVCQAKQLSGTFIHLGSICGSSEAQPGSGITKDLHSVMGCGSSTANVPSAAPVSTNPDDYFPYTGKDVWYTCKADVALELRCAKQGVASLDGCPPTTLPKLLKKTAEKDGSLPALKAERPCPALMGNGPAPPALPDDQWKTWTWKQYYDDVRKAAKGSAFWAW